MEQKESSETVENNKRKLNEVDQESGSFKKLCTNNAKDKLSEPITATKDCDTYVEKPTVESDCSLKQPDLDNSSLLNTSIELLEEKADNSLNSGLSEVLEGMLLPVTANDSQDDKALIDTNLNSCLIDSLICDKEENLDQQPSTNVDEMLLMGSKGNKESAEVITGDNAKINIGISEPKVSSSAGENTFKSTSISHLKEREVPVSDNGITESEACNIPLLTDIFSSEEKCEKYNSGSEEYKKDNPAHLDQSLTVIKKSEKDKINIEEHFPTEFLNSPHCPSGSLTKNKTEDISDIQNLGETSCSDSKVDFCNDLLHDPNIDEKEKDKFKLQQFRSDSNLVENIVDTLAGDVGSVIPQLDLDSKCFSEGNDYQSLSATGITSAVPEKDRDLTFEGTLNKYENIVKNESIVFSETTVVASSKLSSPIPLTSHNKTLGSETESDHDKKLQTSTSVTEIDVDSTNPTPVEGSLVDTPCDSGETSPSTSTPADSCQVSAAPSPLLKEDTTIVSESLLFDESSMDTKDIADDNDADEQEQEIIKPVRFTRRKLKATTMKYQRGRRKRTPVVVDEETRMSANGISDLGIDEDSQSSIGGSTKKEVVKKYRGEVVVPESTLTFTAEKVTEYIWPLEGIGEHYFIQEQISQYLGIMSFKRKYPDLKRRPLESQEKEYLKDLGIVTEIACDLGLTALRSEDVLDIMFNDFPSKYEELQKVLRERKEKQLKEKGKVDYQVVNLDKSKMQEYSRKAAMNASKWNANFNREKHEERRYSFDLQTFTLHMPINLGIKLPPSKTKMGSYPVSVLPGQYTDYCKKYTANELKGMPIQTVILGPFTAEELAAEIPIESDDESAAASIGTCPEIKEEPEITPAVDPLSAEKQPRCKVCNGGRARNKDGKAEPLIICGTCRTPSHPTCIDLTLAMIDKIEAYCWQCMDCKTCAQCNDPDDEERMIFCDMCDRGYHIYCVGLRRVPNGRWHCKECATCFTCGSRNPAGNEHIKNAEWQHEFKKDKDNKQMKYVCTLCVPCDKYWKRRQFCPICMKVYRSIPEDGMVRCSGCPKYVHKEDCSLVHENERFCNHCFKSRNKTALNHSRIIAAAKKKMAWKLI